MKSKLTTLKEAISVIKDGDMVAIGGIGQNKVPIEAVKEIVRQGKKNLHIVGREKGIDFEILIANGCVKKVSSAYVGLEEFGLANNFRKACENGEIEFLEHTCGSIINALRAGAMGIPFIPIKGLYGSDLLKVRKDFKEFVCPFTGEKLVLIPAINPDVCIIHAHESDEFGNIRSYGTRFEDVLMVKASKISIVTVERIIPQKEIRKEPEKTTIPYFYVNYVCEVPGGAKPTSLFGEYPVDREMMKKLIKGGM